MVLLTAHDVGFLQDFEKRPWNQELPVGWSSTGLYLQPVSGGLEIVTAVTAKTPGVGELAKVWADRRSKRNTPVLLVVISQDSPDGCTVVGPHGDSPYVVDDLSLASRLIESALEQRSSHAAARLLVRSLSDIQGEFMGVHNSGLVATQELRNGLESRDDWDVQCERGVQLLPKEGGDLLTSLGHAVRPARAHVHLLTHTDTPTALAVFVEPDELFDVGSARLDGNTPISYALAAADRERVPWVVLVRSGEQIRIHPVSHEIGVGRRGREETFLELNLRVLPNEYAGLLPLIFSADAIVSSGSLLDLVEASADFAADLATRLRERIYDKTVPMLADLIAKRVSPNPSPSDLAQAYGQVLVTLFRLLFIAYGEDKDLLPVRTNQNYKKHSLSGITRRLNEERRQGSEVYDPSASDLWDDVKQLWRAVDKGQLSWGVPAYNGGLFSNEPNVNPAGFEVSRYEFSDAEFAPVLRSLLIDDGPEVTGPVDFRSLSVREFGTIYEGLIENQLSIALTDLTVDPTGSFRPAKDDEDVTVPAGVVYFQHKSGKRKSSGSYFTKPFAVSHLLDHALEPALTSHLARLDKLRSEGNREDLANAFFDFSCADIAMGSGHFLIAAVDRIEARLSGYLASSPIPEIHDQLEDLRNAALKNLDQVADTRAIKPGSILRREIARRCIYGVDKNPMAVELAKLAMWIHTFVPGLPLSFFDHNLVKGDSLTGVGTLTEAVDELTGSEESSGQQTLLKDTINEFISRANQQVHRLSKIGETSRAEVQQARNTWHDAEEKLLAARSLFNLITAARAGVASLPENLSDESLLNASAKPEVLNAIGELTPLHFPTAFPEVFGRERPGFDCIVGNPPWEEAMVDELGFWALYYPGLRSFSQGKQRKEIESYSQERPDLVTEFNRKTSHASGLRQILHAGPFPGMGTGDPDLYRAFGWRFWHLVRSDGTFGVVLPRSALSAKGSSEWRQTILNEGHLQDITTMVNTKGWVFDEVHQQFTIGLVSATKSKSTGELGLRGPFSKLSDFPKNTAELASTVKIKYLQSWTESAAFPLLPTSNALETFVKMGKHPSLGSKHRSWRARPVAELHATNDKKHMVLDTADASPNAIPVYKGASFDIWTPDTGTYYAWAEPETVIPVLEKRRLRGNRTKRSAFSELPSEWAASFDTHPMHSARIAFRDVSRSTDSRTVRAALIPPGVTITNKGPYLLFPRGNQRDEAFLLGVLSSMPLDWFSRRFVEVNVNFHIFNGLPIPEPHTNDTNRLRVTEIAGRLAAVDDRYSDWAARVGVSVGSVDEKEKLELLYELDACVCRLYGLDRSDIETIYGTFHTNVDYSERCEAVVKHWERLQ